MSQTLISPYAPCASAYQPVPEPKIAIHITPYIAVRDSNYPIRQLAIGVNLNKSNVIQPQRIRQLADRGNAEFF